MKPGDYGNISVCRILHFVQGAQTSAMPTLLYPILFYFTLFYSIVTSIILSSYMLGSKI